MPTCISKYRTIVIITVISGRGVGAKQHSRAKVTSPVRAAGDRTANLGGYQYGNWQPFVVRLICGRGPKSIAAENAHVLAESCDTLEHKSDLHCSAILQLMGARPQRRLQPWMTFVSASFTQPAATLGGPLLSLCSSNCTERFHLKLFLKQILQL